MALCVCVMVHAHRGTYASGFVSRSDPLSCTGNTNRSQRTKWGTDRVFGDMGTQCELEHLGCTDHIYYISVNTIRIKGSFSLSCSLLDFTLISALFVFQFVSVDGCTFLEPLSTTILQFLPNYGTHLLCHCAPHSPCATLKAKTISESCCFIFFVCFSDNQWNLLHMWLFGDFPRWIWHKLTFFWL